MVSTVVILMSDTGNQVHVTTYREDNTHVTIHIGGGEDLVLLNEEACWLADRLKEQVKANEDVAMDIVQNQKEDDDHEY